MNASPTGTATISFHQDLLEDYLDTEEKRRDHLRGVRMQSCFVVICIAVGGVNHLYENRAGGWVKLNKRGIAAIDEVARTVSPAQPSLAEIYPPVREVRAAVPTTVNPMVRCNSLGEAP